MISKVVPASSFSHTCRYINSKQGAEIIVSEGVREHSYKAMAEDFIRQQQQRPSKCLACFHGILSFYPGEKPSNELMKAIAKQYLDELGIVNTQYAVTKHTDRAHLHMHIVANLVDNNGKPIKDSYIGLRGKKIAQWLTEEYRLIPAVRKNLDLTHLENLNQSEVNRYTIYMAIAESLPRSESLEEVEELLKSQGIEVQYKLKRGTDEKQGISFKLGKYSFKGSQVDRKYSCVGLQKQMAQQHSLTLEKEILQRAAEVSRHQQKELKPKSTIHTQAKQARNLLEKLQMPEIKEPEMQQPLINKRRKRKRKKL